MRVNLGGVIVGDGRPAYVCAEIGINHSGSVELARQLIDVAAHAGCQAVKLQKRTVDVVYSAEELAKPRESPWGTTNGDQKRGLELGREEYVALAGYAAERGLAFTASCWDAGALADVCEWVDPPWIKVASASLTDHDLLRAHRATGKPLVLSTGMSTIEEIDAALGAIGTHDLVLLACTSTYPCANEEVNLRTITTLRERYGVPVGYSGHERGVVTSVAAAALGACFIERHITLDRTMYGSDQAASLEPQGLRLMVRDIRAVEAALGDGVKRRLPSEEPVRAKLRRVG